VGSYNLNFRDECSIFVMSVPRNLLPHLLAVVLFPSNKLKNYVEPF
jgi:hypothetical protein